MEATTKATNANFTVRNWLFKPFCDLTDKSENIFIRHAPRPRNGVMRLRDKAIVYVGVMNVSDIEGMIETISKMGRVPSVAFSNPEVPRRERTRKQTDKKGGRPERGIFKEPKTSSKPAAQPKTEAKAKPATIMIKLEKGYAEKLLDTIKNIAKGCDVKIIRTNILVTVQDAKPDDVIASIQRVKVNKKELNLSIRK